MRQSSNESRFVTRWAALGALLVLSLSGVARATAQESARRVELRSDAGETNLVLAGTVLHRTRESVTRLREIELPGGSGLVALWAEVGDGRVEPHYAISLDGRALTTVRPADHRLLLRHGALDPLADPPSFAGSPLGPGEGLYLIQFVTQPLEAYLEALKELGCELGHFVARQGYLVRMDASAAEAVARLAYIRWVGPYHGEYRLAESLRDALVTGDEEESIDVFVQLFRRGPEEQRELIEFLEAHGGGALCSPGTGSFLRARIPRASLAELAVRPQVIWIDPLGELVMAMDLVRETGGANRIESALGFTGQGVRGEVMDADMLVGHQEFQATPLIPHGTVPAADGLFGYHGTSTAGIAFAAGVRATARGMLPDAQGIVSDIQEMLSGIGRHAQAGELVDPAGPYRGVFQSHSWGLVTVDSGTGRYDAVAAEIDEVVFDHDLLLCQGMGNGGTSALLTAALGKNVVSVGGVFHHNTLTPDDDTWNGGPSAGFTADGRIKPDLSMFYDLIETADGPGAGAYGQFGGTSAATPIVAGHFGLLFQMWHAGALGNTPSGATVFASRPHSTTAKALLINTATPYPLTQANLTRDHQGWGLPDLARLHDLGNQMLVVDEDDVLAPFASSSYARRFSGQTPLRATLCYLDPPGTTTTTQNRINDLTLRVTSPSNVVYWGNHGLDQANVSSSGGAPDTRDTVENVFIDDPEPGVWLFEVSADEINQDSHVETPALDADYALVISGFDVERRFRRFGGTPGSAGKIILSVPDSVGLGTTFEVRASQAPPNAPAALLLGHDVFFTTTDATGAASLRFDVPDDPALAGARRFLQWVVIDESAPEGFVMSPRLDVRLGP